MQRWLVLLASLTPVALGAVGCRRPTTAPPPEPVKERSTVAADAGLSDEQVLAGSLARLEQFKRESEEAEAAARQPPDAGLPPSVSETPRLPDPAVDREVMRELVAVSLASLEDAVERVHVLFRQRSKAAVPALLRVCAAVEKHTSKGEIPAAERALKRLRELPTGDPVVRTALSHLAGSLAVASAKAAHYEEAREEARAALELEETNPQAYLVLGELEFQANDLKAAVGTWEHGLRLDPASVVLQHRLENAREELGRVGAMERLSSEHFVVSFDGEADVPGAKASLELMEAAYRQVGALFQEFPAGPIPIVLYPHRSFADQGHVSWSAGVYDGKIRLPAEGAAAATLAYKGTLFHEYAHALFHRSTRGSSGPAWLNEGFADVARLRGDPGPTLLCDRSVHSFPLKSLHAGFGRFERRHAHYAYLEARHAVERIIERHGEEGVRALFAAMAAEPDFARAFERALGENYDAFAQAFDADQP